MSDIITPSSSSAWEPADDLDLSNVGSANTDDLDLARATHTADLAMANATEALRRLDTPAAPTGKRRSASRRGVQ